MLHERQVVLLLRAQCYKALIQLPEALTVTVEIPQALATGFVRSIHGACRAAISSVVAAPMSAMSNRMQGYRLCISSTSEAGLPSEQQFIILAAATVTPLVTFETVWSDSPRSDAEK